MSFDLHGVRIYVSFFFAASLTLVSMLSKGGTTAGLLFALAHEAGHLLAMRLLGEKPCGIVFMPFGMKIERKGSLGLSFKSEAVISAAGPLVNLLLFALIAALCRKNDSDFLRVSAAVNLGIGLMNLFPVEPLDGSAVLYNLLCLRVEATAAAKIRHRASLIFLFPLSLGGFVLLAKSGYNFSLLAVTGYLILYFVNNRSDYSV